MKRIGLFLLAVVMVAGCSGDPDEFPPTAENMAGIYNLTKVTSNEGFNTYTFVPPDISGKITLTTAGTYNTDYTIRGDRTTASGTYWFEYSYGSVAQIVFDNGVSGYLHPGGFHYNTYSEIKPYTPWIMRTLEFTRS